MVAPFPGEALRGRASLLTPTIMLTFLGKKASQGVIAGLGHFSERIDHFVNTMTQILDLETRP